jgi:hypothetical protein
MSDYLRYQKCNHNSGTLRNYVRIAWVHRRFVALSWHSLELALTRIQESMLCLLATGSSLTHDTALFLAAYQWFRSSSCHPSALFL